MAETFIWNIHFFVFEHSFAKRNCNTQGVRERKRVQKAKQINGSFYIL